jgi:hypothetical protein
MPEPFRIIRIEHTDHIYQMALVWLTTIGSTCIAQYALAFGHYNLPKDTWHRFGTIQFPDINIGATAIYSAALAVQNDKPEFIEIVMIEKEDLGTFEHTTFGFDRIHLRVIAAEFALLIDSNMDWLSLNVCSDRSKWPSILCFARVIRNAIVHGGSLNITNPKALPVNWKHLEYGPADHGKPILGKELGMADLMLLAIEVGEELDRLGAPKPSP